MDGAPLSQAQALLHQHRIEKVLVVDAAYRCVGLITVKDLEKAKTHPHACKDDKGRLLSLPWSVDYFILYYNKEMFEKKNIAVPKTFEEMAAAAEKLTDPAAGTFGFVGRGLRNANMTLWTNVQDIRGDLSGDTAIDTCGARRMDGAHKSNPIRDVQIIGCVSLLFHLFTFLWVGCSSLKMREFWSVLES
jgi:hypothetical protein